MKLEGGFNRTFVLSPQIMLDFNMCDQIMASFLLSYHKNMSHPI